MVDPTSSPSRYDDSFFATHRHGSQESAAAIAPIVHGLLELSSVIDVGCGVGTWLREFLDLGVLEALGVDGDYVERSSLAIPAGLFRAADLVKPLNIGKTFDLALSLEVAEHLPAESSYNFVRTLTQLAPCVLFSAAIPYQGGQGHINEQWPDYWMAHFHREGFLPIDCIRSRVWTNARVEFWYAQNTFLYVSKSKLAQCPALEILAKEKSTLPVRLVHPSLYLEWATRKPTLGEMARLAVPAIRASAMARFPSIRAIVGADRTRRSG